MTRVVVLVFMGDSPLNLSPRKSRCDKRSFTSKIIKYKVRQPGHLWVLRGVILGFSEEAKTHDFPSPSFGGFGFVGVALSIVDA